MMQSPVVVLFLTFCVGLSHASARRGAEVRSRRMVGGLVAVNVPWQVLLHFGDSVLDGGIGGGALVSDRWILTSGRNLFLNKTRQSTKMEPTTLPKVYLGTKNRNPVDPFTEVEVEKVVLHPHFQNASNWDNNLALIKLKVAVTFSNKVIPIPLPEADQNLEEKEGTQGVMAGWGWGALLTFANHLKFLTVPVVNQGLCQAEYKQGDQATSDVPLVDDNTFCTGATQYTENVCFGDEGGALAVLDPKYDTVYAAGLLSYDRNCQLEKYAVYTKLSAYMPWINSVMREDEKYAALRTTEMHKMLSNLRGV